MKKLLLISLLAITALPAMAAPGGAERQQAFKKILLSFEPMGMVVRGKAPYKKEIMIQQADALKLASTVPFTLFTPNSIDSKSRAKPEIWSQPAKFKTAQLNFEKSVNELDLATRSGDLASIKKHYDVVSQSCKTCHDSFRGPKI